MKYLGSALVLALALGAVGLHLAISAVDSRIAEMVIGEPRLPASKNGENGATDKCLVVNCDLVVGLDVLGLETLSSTFSTAVNLPARS